jgi:hypothetical protein
MYPGHVHQTGERGPVSCLSAQVPQREATDFRRRLRIDNADPAAFLSIEIVTAPAAMGPACTAVGAIAGFPGPLEKGLNRTQDC